MRKRVIINVAIINALCLSMVSCSIVRGYRADGKNGPHIYSFKHHVLDTIAKGEQTFLFQTANQKATWIDTLHFFSLKPGSKATTLPEALNRRPITQGVLIIQNDSIIYERCWGDISTDRLTTVFSISKSITSLMCGIAVDDGYIRSIDDAVTDYLPELKKKDPMWQKLTIRHLLDMRSGLDFDDTYSFSLKRLKRLHAIARLNYGHNVKRQIRGLKFQSEPGTEHRYESMTSQLLGVVIERASGKRFADYLSERVWKPLGMESPALVDIDSRKHDTAHTFGGITLTMKDLAKIGRLYLHNGRWNGQRIVSEEWIRQSTDYNTDNDGYHFNWYNLSSVGCTKPPYPGYYAHGIKGQVLYVNPDKHLIMVRVGMSNTNPVFIPELFEQLSNSGAL